MKKISTGIENFKELIDKNCYYMDKSAFIDIALSQKVSLFTRPRRFGKTLNMSMLYYFLSNKEKENAYLFDGLKITKNEEVMKLQNQFPVIFISLKDIKASSFRASMDDFKILISNLYKRFNELKGSSCLDQTDQDIFLSLREMNSSDSVLKLSLLYLSNLLEAHYHRKVILLIDEYDVPLQAAYQYGYYEEMSNFLSGFFCSVLKTNDALYCGVMTGCLRIAKESIFTGLNNFCVYSILEEESEECFGFTQHEVDRLLEYYQLEGQKAKIKEWYDGYLFGNVDIYNPWSTLYCVSDLLRNPKKEPISYWANTSGNDLVYNYLETSDSLMKEDFERLVQGKVIVKRIRPELTYREMDDINNIYSFLLFTGYLKIKESYGNDRYGLVIPNKEVLKIYNDSFMDYFENYTNHRKKDLYIALEKGEERKANDLLNDILENSISYYDNYENFYHGFLVGLFSDYTVESNKEAGKGRFDLALLPKRIGQTAIIIECKHSKSDEYLVEDAKKGAQQIIDEKYMEYPNVKKYLNSIGYGISFNKKQCYIVKAEA